MQTIMDPLLRIQKFCLISKTGSLFPYKSGESLFSPPSSLYIRGWLSSHALSKIGLERWRAGQLML